MMQGLFEGIEQGEVDAIARTFADDKFGADATRAARASSRHEMRRANGEKVLAELLPARLTEGESWHVVSRGDVDALSYVRHLLAGVPFVDRLLISTWCIARKDLEEITAWLDAGRIEQFDLYAGEIFPNQYGDEYEMALGLCANYGARLVVARNHSKVTLMSNAGEGYFLAIESSANVNTNPRIEQSTLHCSKQLHDFYLEFFDGIRSIDRDSTRK